MALIKCPDCGREISNSAPACIFCGRPLDDLPKKVIRKCGTGEVVVLKQHITQDNAQRYIDSIMSNPVTKHTYAFRSGSQLLIVPDDEPCNDVKCLKNVVTIPGPNWFVLQADHLTQKEAALYRSELIRKFRENDPHYDASRVAIVDTDANIQYHNPNYTFEPYVPKTAPQPTGPRCPTCGSTSVERISTTAKAAGAFAFGLFSKTAHSQFRCKSCGYKW